MPSGPACLLSSWSKSALAAQRPERRRELGAPSALFVRSRGRRHVDPSRRHTGRARALGSLPRKGLVTPTELRRTRSQAATAPAFPMRRALGYPARARSGVMIPTRRPPVPPASAVAAAQRAQAPGATALLRGRWRLAAVKHGRSAMCRIGQGLKPPPRMPSQDRVRAWSLRGHLPHAARPSLSQAAHVAASRGFTRGS